MFVSGPSNPEITGVAVGTLDNSDWYKPDVIVYDSERPIWDVMDPSVETHEKM